MSPSSYSKQFSYIKEHKLETPVTFYDENNLNGALDVLVQGFGKQTQIYYALKSCYNPAVLKFLSARDLGVEVLSELEYEIAKNNGFRSIVLNGMGRSGELLADAVADGNLIVIDTVNDIDILSKIAEKTDEMLRVGFRLRLNFKEWESSNSYVTNDHPLGNNLNSEFFSAFMKFCKENSNVKWEMLHAHITINETSPDIYVKAINEIRKSIDSIKDDYQLSPTIVNIGGGYEVFDPSHSDDFRAMFSDIKNAHDNQLSDYTLAVEPGRYLSAYAGYSIGTVLDIKLINEKYWLITDIGTNTLIPIPNARYKLGYPEISGKGKIVAGITDGITSPANNIMNQIQLDVLPEIGSFICIENTGAYTDVYSTFWAYTPHLVCFVNQQNEISVYRDKEDIKKLKEIFLK